MLLNVYYSEISCSMQVRNRRGQIDCNRSKKIERNLYTMFSCD
jgi:hypothetical protein